MRNFITHFQPMIPQEEPQYQRRIATSQVTTSISITLVLFLMGLFGLILFHARVLSDYVRENIGFSIMIREGVKEAGILQLKKALDGSGYVKSSEYVAKERAAEKLKAELGEDFVGFLGYNPLLPAIDLRIKAPYANGDSLARIEKRLLAYPEVKEVFYQKSLVDAINSNIRKISFILLGFSAILLFIAIVLINNTIRLSVYSRRFIIPQHATGRGHRGVHPAAAAGAQHHPRMYQRFLCPADADGPCLFCHRTASRTA